MVDALGDGVRAAADCDGSFRGVGQHLGGHLDRGSRDLADFLYLGASLTNERAALRGWHNKAERDRRSGDSCWRHEVGQILELDAWNEYVNQ